MRPVRESYVVDNDRVQWGNAYQRCHVGVLGKAEGTKDARSNNIKIEDPSNRLKGQHLNYILAGIPNNCRSCSNMTNCINNGCNVQQSS